METPEEFQPRLNDPSLVFRIKGKGSAHDLKRGLIRFLSIHHPSGTALMMVQALNFNYLYSRDHTERVILVTAENSTVAESVLLDLYARLLQFNSAVATAAGKYAVSIQGNADATRVSILSMHYFWLSSIYRKQGRNDERHLLN